MFLRKIGKFLRGKSTPFQIITATLLGGLLGSLPGISQGPLLMVLLLFLLIVLNANLFIAALTLLLVKLITLILLPLYFHAGVFLLEGPLGGLVAALANAPVTAWFGLEYYVMIPSLLVGGLAGFLVGLYLSRGLRAFRGRMARMETGSERYQAYTSKFWIKAMAWIFFGGLKGKKDWSELQELKRGLPVRPIGVILVVGLLVIGYVGLQFLDRTIITALVRENLERANGATVDIAAVDVLAGQNRVVVSGLAMTDPADLATNRFAASEIVADISGMNLLAKKVVVDSLQISDPEAGTPRRVPGTLTADRPKPEPEPEAEGEVNIYEYIGAASVWRERLAMLKRVYDRVAPLIPKKEAEEEPSRLSWRERLAARARDEGYARMKAESLVRGSPRFWIRDLQADNLKVSGSGVEYRIDGANLSTQPALLAERGEIAVARVDGVLGVRLGLPFQDNPNQSMLDFHYDNLAISDLESQIGKDLPMEGGSMDIAGEGTIDGGILQMPLTVTLKDTTLNAFGNSLPLDSLPLEAALKGPLDQPTLVLPKDAIEEAIKSGGKKQLENLIQEEAGDSLKKFLPFGKD